MGYFFSKQKRIIEDNSSDIYPPSSKSNYNIFDYIYQKLIYKEKYDINMNMNMNLNLYELDSNYTDNSELLDDNHIEDEASEIELDLQFFFE